MAAVLTCARCRKSYWAAPFELDRTYRCTACRSSLDRETLSVDDPDATRPLLPPPMVDDGRQ